MSFFRLFIVGFFLSCCYPAFAGVPDKIEYSEASVDSLYMRAWEIAYSFPDSAIYYADLQQDIAERIGYELGIVNAHYVKGIAFNNNSYFDVAANELYAALSLIKESRGFEFLRKRAFVLQELGRSYYATYNYDMAIEIYQKGLQASFLIKDEDCTGDMYFNLGVCFREMKDFKNALELYQKALKIFQKNENFERVSITYNMMGILHYEDLKFDLAKQYYQKAIALSEEHNTSIEKQSWFISNIGETYFVQEQYDSARYYYSQALALSEKLNDTGKIKWLLNNLGDVSLKEGSYPKAIAYYQKCIALGDEEKIDEEMKRAYKQLAEAYKKMGRYEEAWIYNEKFLAQTTSLQETKYTLIGQNAEHRIKEVEREHQLSKEIAKTTRRKLMSATLALGFSLLVLLYVLKSGKVD